jgi:hypothetical protein
VCPVGWRGVGSRARLKGPNFFKYLEICWLFIHLHILIVSSFTYIHTHITSFVFMVIYTLDRVAILYMRKNKNFITFLENESDHTAEVHGVDLFSKMCAL